MARKHSASKHNLCIVAERLVALLESGDACACVASVLLEPTQGPCGTPSADRYWVNDLLMRLAGTRDARRYREWLVAGRHVAAGATPLRVLVPYGHRILPKADSAARAGHGLPLGFRTVPVFRVEDTQGEARRSSAVIPRALPSLCEVSDWMGISSALCGTRECATSYRDPEPGEAGRCYGRLAPNLAALFGDLAGAAVDRVLGAGDTRRTGSWEVSRRTVAELAAGVLAHMYGYGWRGVRWRHVSDPAGRGADLRRIVGTLNGVCEACLAVFDRAIGVPARRSVTALHTRTVSGSSDTLRCQEAGVSVEAATVTMRAGDMPGVATADSYTLQTVDGAVSLVLGHGVARWSHTIPNARSWTTVPVAVRMTGREFSTLTRVLAGSAPSAHVVLSLDTETCGLCVTVGAQSTCIGAERVDVVTARPLPPSLPAPTGLPLVPAVGGEGAIIRVPRRPAPVASSLADQASTQRVPIGGHRRAHETVPGAETEEGPR